MDVCLANTLVGGCHTTLILFQLLNQCAPMGSVFRDPHYVDELDEHLTNVCHLAIDKGVKVMTAPLAVVGFLV